MWRTVEDVIVVCYPFSSVWVIGVRPISVWSWE